MKHNSCILITVFINLVAPLTQAASIVEIHEFNSLGLLVPDGNPSGLANFQTVSSQITEITSVTLSIYLENGYNGDLYAYLTHDSGFAILLNRSGRTASDSFGYGDSGFNITFDDAAANNIHTYRDQSIPTPGNPLTGNWQPDGRNIDPDLVEDTDASSAVLGSFVSENANGGWTLFIADLSGGSTTTLNSWSMQITGVPEPGTVSLVALAGVLLMRRRRTA